MIEFRNTRKVFISPDGAEVVAVQSLNLRVEDGETHCLIGTSGCGKTTSLKMVNRLIEPTSGTVLVDGVDIRDVDVVELRRRIGYVMQHGGLFPHLSVLRNVAMPCELAGWPSSRREARAKELLELVQLDPDRVNHRLPHELSGGQRQRVGIARALALDPPHILLDEPFGALDPITRADLHREFRQVEEEVGKTMILVTHDLGEAFALGDRATVMDRGHALQTGDEETLRNKPANDFVRLFLTAQQEKGAVE